MDETIVTPEETEQSLPVQVEVVDIQFRPGQKIYFFDPDGMRICAGEHLIIETARGPEYGICTGGNHMVSEKDVVAPLRKVIRLANAQDEKTVLENRQKEKRAHDICAQKIIEHGLDMQLVSAEYAFDGSKILFFFTADERVDFRELVKNLAGIFHTRIELRQIGVRDKAKMVGGLGICGRPFCCAQFLDDFQPVSIKMAKTQNLSLNPTKISGTCGRLMCCLKYEQEAYEDLIRNSPKADSFVDTPDGRGTVVDVNLLRQSVKVRMEENPESCGCYSNCDICVLRNGKAKKNDPPIPADLAPISGSGKRPKKQEEEEPSLLEPVRFRYRTDSVVEEPEQDKPAQPAQQERAEQPQENRSRRNRRPRNNPKAQNTPEQPRSEKPKTDKPHAEKARTDKPRTDKPRADKPKQPPKPRPEQKGEERKGSEPKAEDGEKKNRSRRPNYHRRRKPKAPGAGGQQGKE